MGGSGTSSAASATASPTRRSLRFRYGVQVNSLGLTEAQPENNVQRIVLEALAVTLGRDARARALQLPAWNEALGLPRPWDQQWSLRIQQVLAIRDRPARVPRHLRGLDGDGRPGRRADRGRPRRDGGRRRARRRGRGRRLHEGRAWSSPTASGCARIESGEQKVVGQNCFTETEDSPLTAGADGGILTLDPEVERERSRGARGVEGRARRRPRSTPRWPSSPRVAARRDENIMPATIAAAKAGATTGEWARDAARRLRRLPRARPASAAPPRRRRRRAADDCASEVDARQRAARPPDQDPGRQARPRRPLQRRRADRRARPRRRHGGHLPGHPPDARADRRSARSRRTSTWSASRSSPARTSS